MGKIFGSYWKFHIRFRYRYRSYSSIGIGYHFHGFLEPKLKILAKMLEFSFPILIFLKNNSKPWFKKIKISDLGHHLTNESIVTPSFLQFQMTGQTEKETPPGSPSCPTLPAIAYSHQMPPRSARHFVLSFPNPFFSLSLMLLPSLGV